MIFCKKKLFVAFSMGRNQYWAGRVYDLCVYYMTGTPEGSTESDISKTITAMIYKLGQVIEDNE